MYSLKASSSACTATARSSRSALRVPAVQRAGVRVRNYDDRTTTTTTTTTVNDGTEFQAQASETFNKAVDYVKDVWEKTADAEKPAAIAIILAVTVAQIAVGATMDAVDRIPFVSDVLELIGVAVVASFTYKYVTDPSERASVKQTIDDVVTKITGKASDKPSSSFK